MSSRTCHAHPNGCPAPALISLTRSTYLSRRRKRVEDHYQQYPSEQQNAATRDLSLIVRSLEELSHEFSEQKQHILAERMRLLRQFEDQQGESLERMFQYPEEQIGSTTRMKRQHSKDGDLSSVILSAERNECMLYGAISSSGVEFEQQNELPNHHTSHRLDDSTDDDHSEHHLRESHSHRLSTSFSSAAAPHRSGSSANNSSRQTPSRLSRLLQDHSNIISPLILSRTFVDDEAYLPNISSPRADDDPRHPLPKNQRRSSLRNQSDESLKRSASLGRQRMLDKTRRVYLKKKLQLDLLGSSP
eukprot:CAMPEP_0117455380 /NCGR_PEP_ID=MMETSP0759-20121206/11328_1 /TAXON_ID=63605 /ORGANISM="Percolomonas cosmopolitus, Strain WS" /LENGTH=302 /DNA_ID=CAMNT_0005248679 /DNA_START=103 /DNA_END=1011 /DNA_ORIENTATION=+